MEMAELTKEEMRDRLGNVEQIRNLLFGRNIEEYEQRFENCENRLDKIESDLSELGSQMRDRLTQIEESLLSEMRSTADSLEKKLKYLSLTTHDEITKLQQEIKLTDRKHTSNLNSLQINLVDKTNSLQTELDQSRDKLTKELQVLKEQVFEDIEQRFSNLENVKVSRVDLAEVLFELCLKIKGTEFIPDLKEAAENQTQTDFLLPEQEKE